MDQIDLGVAPTWAHLFYAIPIAVAAFAGIDAVSSMTEDVAQPQVRVPAVLSRSLPLAAVVSILLSLVALSALPVSSNVVPVDTTTGRTVPVAVLPAGDGDGYVLAGDRGTVVVLPVEKHGTSYVIPAQRPTGPVFQQAGRTMTRIFGTQVGGAYLEDPLEGIVAAVPKERGLAQGLDAALGRGSCRGGPPRGGVLDARRLVPTAVRARAGAATTGALRPGLRDEHEALREHHPVRSRRRRSRVARACAPLGRAARLRLRADDRRRESGGRRPALPGAGPRATLPHAGEREGPGRLSAGVGDRRCGGWLWRSGRR